MITPIISSPNLSWLVVLELSHSFSNANGWDLEDLKSISNIPNLGVLSIHGPSFQHPGSQIINDGFLSFWARGARHGGKLKHLRILIIHDDHILSSSYHAKNTAKSMFNDFDSFPSLSVVSLTTGLLYKGFYFIHRELPSLKQDVIQTLSCLGESLGWLNTQRIDKFIPMRPDVRHLLRPWCTRDLAKAYTILNEFEKGSRLAISSPHQSPTASLLALGLGVLADEIFPPLPAGSLPPIMVDLHFKKEQVFSPRDREAHLYAARNVKPWDESYVGFTDERVVFEKHRGRERVPETFLQGETVARGSQKAKRPNKNPTAREHRENGGNAITTKSKSSSSSSLALRNTKKRGIEDTLNDIMFANTRKR